MDRLQKEKLYSILVTIVLLGLIVAVSYLLCACVEVPSDPVVTVDPVTGIATIELPEWKPSVSETIIAVAEEGMTALETILLSGGSLAGVLAAALGVKKGVAVRKQAQEKKKVALTEEIKRVNKAMKDHKKV